MNQLNTKFTKRNVFNLSHDRKFDCDFGQLIPIMCEEILPGDTFKVNTDMLIRFSPMVSPMYHEVNVTTRFFFVPTRLLWSQWETFITGGPDGTATPTYPVKNIAGDLSNVPQYSLSDYLGLPINVAANTNVSALEFRAYNKIWNDWFKDQTLQTDRTISLNGGADITTDVTLAYVNWEKDYFTSALPFTQRGNPVTISLGTSAPVSVSAPARSLDIFEGGTPTNTATTTGTGADKIMEFVNNTQAGASAVQVADGARTLTGTADLSAATPITINDLRLATQTQRLLELLARTGGRYIEYLMGVFGVRSSDARLQRAEYLGGGRSPVVVSEVLQTSQTDTTPQGHMAGHGFSAHRSHEFRKSFEEHGYVIGLLYVLPRTSYSQGIPRRWSRSTRFDFYHPQFAHLGEQAVLKKEIWLDAADGENEQVWAYQGRGDEYRRRESSVHGNFRSPTGLGTFHMGRLFTVRPELEETFIKANTVTKRTFADTTDPPLWVYLKNNVVAIRPLPKIGEPGFMDH